MQIADQHLGGYIVGGDPATHYPDLWNWVADNLHVGSVLDLGCGEGHTLQHFRNLGCRVFGVDGIPQDDPDILEHDYTTGPLVLAERFDLAWSCEFVEHVEERFAPNFLQTFKAADVVLLTHAEPGQAGWHHVNCRPRDYWEGAMAATGFTLDHNLTNLTREYAAINTNPYNHYRRSGLAFRNNNT